jgi:hypothetical protein
MIKSSRLRWASNVVRKEEGMGVFKITTDKPTGKSHWKRPKSRWEENIRNGS